MSSERCCEGLTESPAFGFVALTKDSEQRFDFSRDEHAVDSGFGMTGYESWRVYSSNDDVSHFGEGTRDSTCDFNG